MMFGAKTPPEQAWKMIDRAIEAGVNFLDTSNSYSRGRSEEVTGEALRRNGKRSRIVLATKVHSRMSDEDPNMYGNSRRNIMEGCEASLRRLQTDYIDLYQIHRPQSDIPIDETLRAMDDLIRAGKVRYIGTSTFSAWQCVEALWVADRQGLNRFVSEQPPYNILDRRAERELFRMAETYGCGILPWSPLAGGLLTGKYRRGEAAPEGSRFEKAGQVTRLARRFNEQVYDVVEGMDALVAKHGATHSQIALAWTLEHPAVTSPIIGPRTMEQLEDNLKALEVRLDAEDLALIDTLVPPGGMVSEFYQADFGPHRYR